ncbi:MAG: hypothetical protein COB49_11440 [Alphaproteobacteria bacterium]|nr:MAG: hypothetical protein COB49_11440 [Alphaproteobacteria bacterium]
MNYELENIWSHMINNGTDDTDAMFQKAVISAQASGFSCSTTNDITKSDIEAFLSRILNAKDHEKLEPEKALSMLVQDKPSYPLSQAQIDYFSFEKPNLMDKSAQQIKKWENPRKRAVLNFITACGNMEVANIKREDIYRFREWWFQRIKNEGLNASSANKDLSHLRQVLSYARDNREIDLSVETLFTKMNFAEHDDQSRQPFETDYIQNTLLNPSKLSGMNEELQLFLFAMADTGARPNELLGLDASDGDIMLDAEIPYIFIRPNTIRRLKTSHSNRKIPLVGASLYAFKNLPHGFVKYRNRSDQLSAALNKYLRTNGLFPTKNHTVYSLRHSFEDRLTAVEPPEKVQAALMGHKYHRERYGKGPTLELKKKYLDKICFDIQ